MLVSSVKTLWLSLLNLCCVFNNTFLYFVISFRFQHQFPSFLNSLLYFQFEMLLNVFYNISWHTFLSLLLFHPHYYCLLNSLYACDFNPKIFLMICPTFINLITFFFFSHWQWSMYFKILQNLCKYHLVLHEQWNSCIHITKFCIFTIFWFI